MCICMTNDGKGEVISWSMYVPCSVQYLVPLVFIVPYLISIVSCPIPLVSCPISLV